MISFRSICGVDVNFVGCSVGSFLDFFDVRGIKLIAIESVLLTGYLKSKGEWIDM